MKVAWKMGDGRECFVAPQLPITSRADGSFSLPLVPHGDAEFRISHEQYAEREFRVTVPAPKGDIVMDRGGSWIGRVIDPDGRVLDRCRVSLNTPLGGIKATTCSATGFNLQALPSGAANVLIQINDDPKLGVRALYKAIVLKPDAKRIEDVFLPAGETIAGQLLTSAGQPLGNTRLAALPKGQKPLVHQFRTSQVTVQTDANGRFAFRHLSHGIWVLRNSGAKQIQREASTGSTDVRMIVP